MDNSSKVTGGKVEPGGTGARGWVDVTVGNLPKFSSNCLYCLSKMGKRTIS